MSLYSTYWYRVRDIRPKLRSHVAVNRHFYRGEDWYILQDPATGRQHRFNKNVYFLLSLMDGERTTGDIWDKATQALGDEVPTQDEVIRLLSQLHESDVLQSDTPPDTRDLFNRQHKQKSKWKQRVTNPFALRFPLVDPDRFLKRFTGVARPLMSWWALMVWIIVVGAAFFAAAAHWPELTRNMSDRVLSAENLFILWLVYPAVKLFHELAHGFATRIHDGEIHEMGVMLLAFTPIPYVEASASAAFPNKYSRMLVAGAGMAIELFIAALALFLWLNIEPGTVRSVAYNVMLIGGVSTLLFNGNPLLRYDGYYILADFVEIPNLAGRSKKYLGYLFKRYLLGMKDEQSPVTSGGEASWFVVYGVLSFCYRMFVLTMLALFISTKFFIIGVLIACWALGSQIVVPAIRNSYGLYKSSTMQQSRVRLLGSLVGVVFVFLVLFFVLPVPQRTRVEGVVSLPEQSRVRAGTDCFLVELLVQPGDQVETGAPLMRCEAPFLDAELKVLTASLAEARVRYDAEPLSSRTQREIYKDKHNAVLDTLLQTRERAAELIIRSPNQGVLILPGGDELIGRYVKQGDLLGYITAPDNISVMVAISQADIALVRESTSKVEIRPVTDLSKTVTTSIDRATPAASGSLPSPVLGTVGGGKIPIAPDDPKGLKMLNKIFQFEFSYPVDENRIRIGERVHALFHHGYEPLGMQWYRRLRQLFLRHFHV